MATTITDECINCGACEPECPNTAIYQGGVEYDWQGAKNAALSTEYFYIVPEKCTECVGFYDQEACAAVCPVDCCVPDPARPETEDALMARSRELHPGKEFPAEFPSRFKAAAAEPEAASAPGAGAAAPAGDGGAGYDAGQGGSTGLVLPVTSIEEFDVPVPCESCGGEYEVGYRFLSPGTVLRCPHCGVSFSPTQQMFLLVSEALQTYADTVNQEIDRHTQVIEREQKLFDRSARSLRSTAERQIRETMERLTEPPKRSIFG